MIGFTNAAPFRLVPPRFSAAMLSGDPSELTARMAAGQLDACLLPTGAFERLGDRVRSLGPYGIACYGHVMSLRLFSKVPVLDLLQEGHAVYVTPRTTTTRELLQVLFRREFGRAPHITEDRSDCDACLLIGDEAMDFSQREYRWPVAKDIGEWWFSQTGLGYVFAQWVVSSTANEDAVASLQGWLEENLAFAATAEGRRGLREAGVAAGWSPAMADLYFERLEFRLTRRHTEGLAAFQRILKGTDDGD
jgi:chorismate dehydratase